MKQYTSSTFKTIAAILMGFPLVYIVLVATSFNVPVTGCARLLLSPVYYLVTGTAVVAGYGFWQMQRWGWYVFWAAQGLIAYGNAIIASEFAESHHRVFVFLISLILQGLVGHRMGREVLVPYFFPAIRWWETNPRYKLAVPVTIQRTSGEGIAAEILDLSVVGCFIKSRNLSLVGERVELSFELFGLSLVVTGTIVWDAMSTVTHPKGVGIIFEHLPKEQKKRLRLLDQRLRKIASHYRKYRYWMEPIEFDKILLELESAPFERPRIPSLVRPKGEVLAPQPMPKGKTR